MATKLRFKPGQNDNINDDRIILLEKHICQNSWCPNCGCCETGECGTCESEDCFIKAYKITDEYGAWSHCLRCDCWFTDDVCGSDDENENIDMIEVRIEQGLIQRKNHDHKPYLTKQWYKGYTLGSAFGPIYKINQ